MKIIICVKGLKWGIGQHVIKFVKNLEKKEEVEKILILSPDKINEFGDKVFFYNIKISRGSFLINEPLYIWRCTRAIESILKDENFDIIDVRQPSLFKKFDIPIVYNVHWTHFQYSKKSRQRFWFFYISFFHKLYSYFEKKQFQLSKKIIFQRFS